MHKCEIISNRRDRYIESDGIDLVSFWCGTIGLLSDLLLLLRSAFFGSSVLLLLFETTDENDAKNGQEYDADGSEDGEPYDQKVDYMAIGFEVIIEPHYGVDEQAGIGQRKKDFKSIHYEQDHSQRNAMAVEKD